MVQVEERAAKRIDDITREQTTGGKQTLAGLQRIVNNNQIPDQPVSHQPNPALEKMSKETDLALRKA